MRVIQYEITNQVIAGTVSVLQSPLRFHGIKTRSESAL